MSRKTYLFLIIGVSAIFSFISILMEEFMNINLFDYRITYFVHIAIYIPIVVILRSRYLKVSCKDFFKSLIPLIGLKNRFNRFSKP